MALGISHGRVNACPEMSYETRKWMKFSGFFCGYPSSFRWERRLGIMWNLNIFLFDLIDIRH